MRLFERRVFILNCPHSNYRLAEACLVYNLKTLDTVYFSLERHNDLTLHVQQLCSFLGNL